MNKGLSKRTDQPRAPTSRFATPLDPRSRESYRLRYLTGGRRVPNLSVKILLLFVLLQYGMLISRTYSDFIDSGRSEAHFRSVTADKILMLLPGKAKATSITETEKGEPESFSVATGENTDLMLYFGEVPEGNGKNFPDIFRIRNLMQRSLQVSFALQGEIKELFESFTLSLSLDPRETGNFDAKLVTKDKTPGLYRGYVVVTSLGSYYYQQVPVSVTIVDLPKDIKKEVDKSVYEDVYLEQIHLPLNLTEPVNSHTSGIVDRVYGDTATGEVDREGVKGEVYEN
ncbi:hypothetical protein [Calderihabitans maritimus]|uniref:Uncharacterized protein n=1 Tax=Calderihabitans maritimus TaxID=1246530 RepID=A0A1Z5HR23_9FIRM|nr:hypothetical protein [Calderihabitans maritimus]GAW91969.1 hypothetical protein KKC1_11290 [Calderihabitans maritimus]